jgi:hypothetical protein
MKKLLASLLLLASASIASSAALSQSYTYAPEEGIHWIDGKTVTITYSPNGVPGVAPPGYVEQTIADVEARLNALNLPGLTVRVGRLDLPNACAHKDRNTVHICWELRDGRRVDSINTGNTDGASFWREGIIILANNADWTDATRPLYQQLHHYLLHILGFSHPARDGGPPSVINNNAMDLTAQDIEGLQNMYTSTRCAVTYDTNGTIRIPFVTYQGLAYTGRIQRDSAGGFSLVPGTLGRYGYPSVLVAPIPTSPCQGLQIDGSNELHLPQVWVNGELRWLTLRFTGERFTVTASNFL